VRLLAGHRDDLVAERTRIINRLRWHLHELDPGWEPAARSLWRPKNLSAITERLTGLEGLVARLARTHVERCRELTSQIRELDRELEPLVARPAPALVALCGCATLTAAKIIGETAGVERFRSRHAFARHSGTATVPVWSSNRHRLRLSRTGNRQLNAAIHRIAVTQAHHHPQGQGDAAAPPSQRRHQGRVHPGPQAQALRRRLPSTTCRY